MMVIKYTPMAMAPAITAVIMAPVLDLLFFIQLNTYAVC